MRVLQVVTLMSGSGAFGGPSSVAVEQVQGLAAMDHEVTLVAGVLPGDEPQHQRWQGRLFRARRLLPMKFTGLWAPGMLIWLIRNLRRFDAVHVHLGRDLVTLPAAMLVLLNRRRLIVQTHIMVQPDRRLLARLLDRLATRPVIRRAQVVLALSPVEQLALQRVAGVDAVIIQNPIRADEAGCITRARARNIIFAGRLHPNKNLLILVDVAARLQAYGEQDLRFVIVGPDQGESARLLAAAQQCGVEERFVLRGGVDRDTLRDYLRDADIFVLPSLVDSAPMALYEAMSVGLPCLISDRVEVAQSLVAAGAVAVAAPDAESFQEALELLIGNEDMRRALGSQGQAFTRSTLSPEAVAEELTRHYRGA